MIKTDSILLSGLRKFPGLGEERKKMRFIKKKTLKNMSNSDKNDKINVLIK